MMDRKIQVWNGEKVIWNALFSSTISANHVIEINNILFQHQQAKKRRRKRRVTNSPNVLIASGSL